MGFFGFSRAAHRLRRAAVSMPLSDAAKAAVEGFLRSKRGSRTLHDTSVAALLNYFVAKNISLPELPTDTPATPQEVEDWVQEWCDYGEDSGLTDKSQLGNISRWIRSDDVGLAGLGSRSGKAHAVADVLAKRGLTVDRGAELAIAQALVEAEKG